MQAKYQLRHSALCGPSIFLQGYTLCANGENTFFTKGIREFQKNLHRGYVGFESDSLRICFYTLHYVHRELGWPARYVKHVLTPLSAAEVRERPDGEALEMIRESLSQLQINGPNAASRFA